MPPEDQEPTSAPEPSDKDIELAALRKQVDKLMTEKKALKDVVKAPEGVTVDEITELKAFKRQVELEREEKKGSYDKAKKALQEQYDKDTAELRAENQKLRDELRELRLVAPATSAMAAVVHDPDYLFEKGLLKPEQIENGPDGLMFVDGLKRVPLADYALEVAPPYLRKAPKPQGSGAPAGGSAGGLPVGTNVKNPFVAPHFSLAEQGRLLRSNPALYAQMKAAAGL